MEDEELKKYLEKLDARLDTLEKPPEEEKEDTEDPRIVSAQKVLIKLLTPYFKEDTLKDKTFDQLLLIADLKEDFTPPVKLNPAPPLTKEDAKDDPRPEWLRPTVNAS